VKRCPSFDVQKLAISNAGHSSTSTLTIMASTPVQARQKKSRGRWRILRIAAVAVIIWSGLAFIAARSLITRAELASADALVVMAGSSTYLERTDWAARLYREGRAPLIILTNDGVRGGWSVAEQRNPLFVELAAAELRRAGVPGEKIEIIQETATGTYEEALRLREYSVAHKLRSILVVTSAYHSRRALWTLRRVFEGSGIEIGLDAPAPGIQTPTPATWWWHPMGWQIVPGEYVKIIYYWMKY
jgi:uncharacterized SAM-binding protein YcdF (DUF218 family)